MSAGNNGIFKYGQFERAIDATDYVYQEKVEVAIGRMQERIESAKMMGSKASALREMVQAVAGMFDEVLGDGAANQILGGSTSLDASTEALRALVEYNRANTSASVQRWTGYAAQFGPNRAQRRAAGK